MATILRKPNANRTVSYVAQVRVRPFKPIAKSFATKSEAERWAEETEASLRENRKAGAQRPDLPNLTLAGLNKEYLKDDAVTSLRSAKSTEDRLAWWTLHYGTELVRDLDPLALRAARDKLRPGRAPATVNRYIAAQRAAWNWGRNAGLVPRNAPWPTRLMLREPKGRTRYLSDDELAALLKAARATGPVIHAAIIVAVSTGVRRGELLRLRWADVTLEAPASLRILETKNGTSRAVHLPSVAVAALKELKRGKVIGRPVFLNADGEALRPAQLDSLWAKVRKAASLRDFKFHDLRHSCASFLAQNGATLLEIGSVLGHKSPSVTQRYSHLIAGQAVTGHSALDKKVREALPT